MPRIVFDKVEKSFGSVNVLPPLDLTFETGEFTVLVGPSGCGKSTTLRILAGLETVSGGEIYFDDRPISKLEPKQRDIAMVFQDYALYPHMNIAQNMSFALRLGKRPKSEITAKVNEVAETLNIRHLLDRKPAELSGGQRQRVAMGRALTRDASTFLFDEPLSNLDAKLRAKMRTELAEMREALDKNMVYVTHDQVEAMTLGERIVVMKDGVVQQQGSPEELFKRPVNMFVAGFLGSPTTNFIAGHLTEADGALRVQGTGFDLPLAPELAARVRDRSDGLRDVVVGIRPSSIGLEPTGAQLELTTKVSEYLGSQSVLVTHCGDQEILVELESSDRIQTGSTLSYGVNLSELMLFDPKTEQRI